MKILMIHPHDIYSPLEPWTIRVTQFACELVKKGHQVTLAHFPYVTNGGGGVEGVRIVSLERVMSPVAFVRNTHSLCQLSRDVDIVHFQKSQFYAALPAVVAGYMTGKHLHYDWDDWEEKIFYASIVKSSPSTILAGFSFMVMERCLPFLVDSISVSSEALRGLAIAYGADQRKIVLAPVGGDLKRFHPGQDGAAVRKKFNITTELLVFYHGQLHSCQYVRLLLKAIRILDEKKLMGRLKFMVLGGGSELESLLSFARELGIMDHVIFADCVPHADVPSYIAAADICVAPFEDNEVTRCKSPLKIVEYLASGKPIVASDVGEVRHMLGAGGLLVRPGLPEEIARGILELANNEVLRKTLSHAAWKQAQEKYSWRYSVEALEKAYERGC